MYLFFVQKNPPKFYCLCFYAVTPPVSQGPRSIYTVVFSVFYTLSLKANTEIEFKNKLRYLFSFSSPYFAVRGTAPSLRPRRCGHAPGPRGLVAKATEPSLGAPDWRAGAVSGPGRPRPLQAADKRGGAAPVNGGVASKLRARVSRGMRCHDWPRR